jgi:hypothetical protein
MVIAIAKTCSSMTELKPKWLRCMARCQSNTRGTCRLESRVKAGSPATLPRSRSWAEKTVMSSRRMQRLHKLGEDLGHGWPSRFGSQYWLARSRALETRNGSTRVS